MNVLKEQALAFISRLQDEYLCNRDYAFVLSSFTPDVTWIGSGGEELIFEGYPQAEAWLQGEYRNYQNNFTILKKNNRFSLLAPDSCLIYGELLLVENDPQLKLSPFSMRFSAVCLLVEGVLKLHHLHLSQPSASQETGEYFPTALDQQSGERLRSLYHEKARDLQILTDNLPGGIFRCLFDKKLTILQMSEGFLQIFGYTREEIFERFADSFWEMIYSEDREGTLVSAMEQMKKGSTKELEYRVIRKDGSFLWVSDRGQLVKRENGDTFCCILLDITKTKQAQEELRLSLERHKIIMDQTTDIIFEWDLLKDSLIFSGNWYKRFGYDPISKNVPAAIAFESHIHLDDLPAFLMMVENILKGVPYLTQEFRIADSEGVYFWFRIRATTQFDKRGLPCKSVGVILDIDSEKRMVQVLQDRAERDILTGAYNKMTVQTLIRNQLLEDSGETKSALLIIDIDNFKLVNDTLGHPCGDSVLVALAESIRGRFRATDIVGRIGGDEFMVLLKSVPDGEFVTQKVGRLLQKIASLQVGDSHCHHISCSIGIAIAPDHGKSFEDLYRSADHALYQAKKLGKNGYYLFDPKTCAEEDLQQRIPTPVE